MANTSMPNQVDPYRTETYGHDLGQTSWITAEESSLVRSTRTALPKASLQPAFPRAQSHDSTTPTLAPAHINLGPTRTTAPTSVGWD